MHKQLQKKTRMKIILILLKSTQNLVHLIQIAVDNVTRPSRNARVFVLLHYGLSVHLQISAVLEDLLKGQRQPSQERKRVINLWKQAESCGLQDPPPKQSIRSK